jgi:hypothetical protein
MILRVRLQLGGPYQSRENGDMGGWNTAGSEGWHMRRENAARVPRSGARWTAPDIFLLVAAFFVHWEFGLAALALKLWHQASNHPGNVFAFAREKWESLVEMARGLLSNAPAMSFGPRSSGNLAFDAWRSTELQRIEAERTRLRGAEREFTAYREQLLHAKDQDDFDRFMRDRGQAPR